MYKSVVLLVLLAIQCGVLAQTQSSNECSNDSDCSLAREGRMCTVDIATSNIYKVCKPYDSSRNIGETCTVNKAPCSQGFCNGVRCVSASGDGCSLQFGANITDICVYPGQDPQSVTCRKPTVASRTKKVKEACSTDVECYSGKCDQTTNECQGKLVNEICDSTFECAWNLWCKNRKCSAVTNVGYPCISSTQCAEGSTCFEGYCIAYYSLSDYSYAAGSGLLCDSGYTDDNYCAPRVKVCTRNSDCRSGLCDAGKCIDPAISASKDVMKCALKNSCSAPFTSGSVDSDCVQKYCAGEWVRSKCADGCFTKFPSPTQYQFDCSAKTFTAQCANKTPFLNCDYSGASMVYASFASVAIAAVLLALF